MRPSLPKAIVAVTASIALVLGYQLIRARWAGAAVVIPDPVVDVRANATEATAVFAGGCFWGVQAVFQHVRGVTTVVSGYSGGEVATPTYSLVSSGMTGHAEAVQVTYDPSRVSYGTLLKVFFAIAHDPTQLNRQGPDRGTQYRSAIFYGDAEQGQVARSYIEQLARARVFAAPIVTQVAPLSAFHIAEDYHQDYAVKHPYSPYIMIHDAPKVKALEANMPEVWRE